MQLSFFVGIKISVEMSDPLPSKMYMVWNTAPLDVTFKKTPIIWAEVIYHLKVDFLNY